MNGNAHTVAGTHLKAVSDLGPVATQINEIEIVQNHSFDLVDRIEQRLSLILEGKSGGTTAEASPPYSTELQQQLRKRYEHAGYINERLEALLNRIVL